MAQYNGYSAETGSHARVATSGKALETRLRLLSYALLAGAAMLLAAELVLQRLTGV